MKPSADVDPMAQSLAQEKSVEIATELAKLEQDSEALADIKDARERTEPHSRQGRPPAGAGLQKYPIFSGASATCSTTRKRPIAAVSGSISARE